VCRSGYSPDADFAARMMFFDGVGMREDPATGSANAAFASYLRDRGVSGRRIVEQGFEIRRPSRIYLAVGESLAVGGRVQPVAEGRLL
jgi:trans-2,3-dihydro-3-hydroxyanthranilate isomerase